MKYPFLAIVVCLSSFLSSSADIAPTRFAGGTIVPVEISDLRFNDAHVRIQWGTPCSLDASFEIVNDRKEPVALEIGFPVGGYDPAYGYNQSSETKQENVTTEPVPSSVIDIAINGKHVEAFRRIKIPKQFETRFGLASWYFTNATLAPGSNSIVIKTSLKASGVYGQPFQRRLEYCLWTGGRWNGRIKHETIEIIFPGKISDSLIQESKQNFFEIKNDRLVWDYSNIEPRDNSFDIDLVVQIPEIDAGIAKMEREFHSNPEKNSAGLKLAKHLFLLGNLKGNSGFPPERLSMTEYYQILSSIEGTAKETFVRQYPFFRGENVAASSSEWTKDRVDLIQILADLKYCENYSGVGNALKAKKILDEILSRDPHNEDAWLLLLRNYWRFSFAAKGHWFGPTVLGVPQVADIRKAHRLCPRSKAIKVWYDLIDAKDVSSDRAPVEDWGSAVKDSEFRDVLTKYGDDNE